VAREVHATAGQEASATCSCGEPQPEAKQEIYSIRIGEMLLKPLSPIESRREWTAPPIYAPFPILNVFFAAWVGTLES
jgi:hypothetical protein